MPGNEILSKSFVLSFKMVPLKLRRDSGGDESSQSIKALKKAPEEDF